MVRQYVRCDRNVQLFCLDIFLPHCFNAVCMKVKKKTKINNGIYNVVPSSFKFAQKFGKAKV